MTELASSWNYVPEKQICVVNFEENHENSIYPNLTYIIKTGIYSDGCLNTSDFVRYLEHVQLELDLRCNTTEVDIQLVSPLQTHSPVLTKIKTEEVHGYRLSWKFMSVHFWGEDPNGLWTVLLTVSSHIEDSCKMTFKKLIFHGTNQDPMSMEERYSKTCNINESYTFNPETKSNHTLVVVIVVVVIVGGVGGVILCVYLKRCRRSNQSNSDQMPDVRYTPTNVENEE